MEIDVILLSNAKDEKLKRITQNAIDTCHKSERNIQFDIVVIEQSEATYEGATTVKAEGEFNYNKFLNLGVSVTNGEYIALCNNDLLFQEGWATNIVSAMKANYLLSASPFCPYSQGRTFKRGNDVEFGYSNAKHLSGWCIVVDRFIFDIIGKIDENFPFWFADNAYAEQLKSHNVKHALVRNSIVTHLGSKTLKTNDEETKHSLTMAWAKKWIKKYPNNESAIYFSRFV